MRKHICLWLLSMLMIAFCGSANSQTKPRIGLTLGGGGARGLAHIGVLKVLEEYGIYPDLVTGTSMGSIIGGLYAIGYTPEQLEEFAQQLEWNDYFSDTYPRAFLPVEERQRADRYQLTFAVEDGKLQLPRGLIDGRKILTLLSSLTSSVHEEDNFDDFYLPFRCIATDLETGKAYVFSNGDLRRAIRASMSIPSVFAPLDHDDRLLVDGLLVRNLPVTDALDMGADMVLAVDVGTPLYKRDELGSILRVLEQSASFGGAVSTLEQRALADFLVLPDLDPFTTLSYDQADSLILRGELSARKLMPDLLEMLDSLGIRVPMQPRKRPAIQLDSFEIRAVQFAADNPATTQAMRKIFEKRLPATLTNLELSNQIGRLYSSGFLDFVDYELVRIDPDTNQYRLQLSGKGAPRWLIRASLNYDNDLNAGVLFNVTGRNVLSKGSLLSADLRISENPGFFLDYQVYTRTTPSIGLSWRNRIDFFPGRIYDEAFRRTTAFQFHQLFSEFSIFSGLGPKILVEAGVKLERLTQNRRFYTFEDGEAVLSQFGGIFQLKRETYDRASFPRRGSNSTLRFEYSFSGKIRERSGERRESRLDGNALLSAHLFKVFPVGDHFWFDLFSGAGFVNYRERNLINLLYLGRAVPNQDRFFEFYGLRYMEQPVTSFGYIGLKLRQEIGRSNYFSLGANYGRYILSDFNLITESGSLTRERTEGNLWGLGLELGSITPLGPVRFTSEYNLKLDRFNFSLHAGYYF